MPRYDQNVNPEGQIWRGLDFETNKAYECFAETASSHTKRLAQFNMLFTDIDNNPLQDIDVQFVPHDNKPIDTAIEAGELLSPGLKEYIPEFKSEFTDQIDEVHNALKEGKNVIVAVPSHSQVHDIVFPFGLLAKGLKDKYDLDEPSKRLQFFAKSLAWYEFQGISVPELARVLGNVIFSIPHSSSGYAIPEKIRTRFNQRARSEIDRQLDSGGNLVTLASGGSTNKKKYYGLENDTTVVAECQPLVHDSTARILQKPDTLVIPSAVYLDPNNKVSVRLGELKKLTNYNQCLKLGVWAAKAYTQLSGINTFQATTQKQIFDFEGIETSFLQTNTSYAEFLEWLNEFYYFKKGLEPIE